MDYYSKGTHYPVLRDFGSFEVTDFLNVLAEELPVEARLVLTNPIDKNLRKAVPQFATQKSGLLSRSVWFVTKRAEDAASIRSLARFARDHKVSKLAVWICAEAGDSSPLVEAEDGNDYIWLSHSLTRATHQRIVGAVGGQIEAAG